LLIKNNKFNYSNRERPINIKIGISKIKKMLDSKGFTRKGIIMNTNIIEEYLVKIGYTIDKQALNNVKKSMEDFRKSLLPIAAGFAGVTAALTGVAAAAVTAGNKLGNITTGVDKFALSLYTTRENALSLQQTMNAMDIKSLEDLKYINLMPEQRQQFMELRKLSQDLAPDAETQKGLNELRKLGFQFQKMQIEMSAIGIKALGTLGRLMETPLFKKIPDLFELGISILAWIGKMIGDKLEHNPIKTAKEKLQKEFAEQKKHFEHLGNTIKTQSITIKKEIEKKLEPIEHAIAPIRNGHHSLKAGVKTTPAINNFLRALDQSFNSEYLVTSGLDHRSGASWHPKGLAADLVPRNTSIKGYADLVSAMLTTSQVKRVNLELSMDRFLQVQKELVARNVNYSGRLSHQITKDFTGEHAHATLRPVQNISFVINGARDPRETANQVGRMLQTNGRFA